jgi:hypothetical protein
MHPQSVLEVRRVLLEQVAELERFPDGDHAQVAIKTDVNDSGQRP